MLNNNMTTVEKVAAIEKRIARIEGTLKRVGALRPWTVQRLRAELETLKNKSALLALCA